MKQEKLLTIAIPSFRNWRQLVDCLHTLTHYTEFPYRIVVVNNGSASDADGRSFERELRERITYPDLHIIQTEQNLGWQKAINLAFEHYCDTPYFCMANDDLLFIPGQAHFWWKLLSPFQYPDVGAVGPMSNYVMGSQSLFDHRGAEGVYETTLLIGFLMAVRSKSFAEVGGLDEGLGGGDDLDLSILLRKAGYHLIVNRHCYVHHIGSQTGPRVTPQDYWNSARHVEATNNALIRKHGVRVWYNTIMSRIDYYEPMTEIKDTEGDLIRARINGGKGLDVGCGANKTILTAIGIDLDPKGVRGHAGGRKNSLSEADMVADALDLPFDDGSQDYVVARHILEHMLDPITALEEWHRVLKPDGILAIACPDETRVNTMLIDWTHKHAYSPSSLARLIQKAGFEVELPTFIVDPGISFVQFSRKAKAGCRQ